LIGPPRTRLGYRQGLPGKAHSLTLTTNYDDDGDDVGENKRDLRSSSDIRVELDSKISSNYKGGFKKKYSIKKLMHNLRGSSTYKRELIGVHPE